MCTCVCAVWVAVHVTEWTQCISEHAQHSLAAGSQTERALPRCADMTQSSARHPLAHREHVCVCVCVCVCVHLSLNDSEIDNLSHYCRAQPTNHCFTNSRGHVSNAETKNNLTHQDDANFVNYLCIICAITIISSAVSHPNFCYLL